MPSEELKSNIEAALMDSGVVRDVLGEKAELGKDDVRRLRSVLTRQRGHLEQALAALHQRGPPGL